MNIVVEIGDTFFSKNHFISQSGKLLSFIPHSTDYVKISYGRSNYEGTINWKEDGSIKGLRLPQEQFDMFMSNTQIVKGSKISLEIILEVNNVVETVNEQYAIDGGSNISSEYKENHDIRYPDEETASPLIEGLLGKVYVNRFERNEDARKQCINYYLAKCRVCKFDFSEVYGDVGEHFIHVHHLIELSSIRESYVVDPIKHLRPVCANCHAMLHKRKPAYTIEELQNIIDTQKAKIKKHTL